MASVAGHTTEVYITTTDTNPGASDLIGHNTSAGWNPSMAELDTSSLSEAFTKFILGQETIDVSLSLVYDSADTAQGRIKSAFEGRSSIWVHVALTGTTACAKAECKVLALNFSLEPGSAVTLECTIKSVGARSTSTVS